MRGACGQRPADGWGVDDAAPCLEDLWTTRRGCRPASLPWRGMELTLTVHVPRRRAHPLDVVVHWSGTQTAVELCAALSRHLGHPVMSLRVGGRSVPPATVVGHPPLLHGCSVTVDAAPGARPGTAGREAGTAPVLELAVVGGPDAGRSRELRPPGLAVGRTVADGLSLGDDALSRRHAEIGVDASGVVVRDVGSTNGVLVDGRLVRGAVTIDSTSSVVLGASTLRVRRRPGAGLPVTPRGDGRLAVPTVVAPRDDDSPVVVDGPRPPPERQRARMPWIAALVPVPVAAVMALVFGPQLLAFALLGPVLMLGSALGDRVGSGRAHRRAVAGHAVAREAARAHLDRLVRDEVTRVDHHRPDPAAVLRRAELRLPGLWVRRDLRVRLGLGDAETRVVWSEGTVRQPARASHAPVVVDLAEGGLWVVGPPEATRGALASVIGQLAVQCPPSVVRLAVTGHDPDWDWLARLPHAVGPPGRGGGPGRDDVVPGPPRSRGREEDSRTAGGARADAPHRVLLVPRADAGSLDTLAAARAGGWVVAGGAPRLDHLFGVPGAVVDVSGGWLTRGTDRVSVVVDRVGPWWVDRLSRALAPLVEEASEDDPGLPRRVRLDDLTRTSEGGAAAICRRWSVTDGRARAVVGCTDRGPWSIDLVQDGPHVLVGGTTGSGKSEFLRTLVLSLATALPPDDLALVLVDFKGGSAFGACARLPHVVGLVTDLDAHLVDRALSSLGAELRRRERLFASVGASHLDQYRRAANRPEPLPRLVVVVDELKALVDEVPHFVDGLVRLAALGRSLGVHLVLATQRPSGTVSAAVQANVNLRIAFRVRDRTDSVDVVEDPAAALIPPTLPGRGCARGGDGRLVTFQAAVVADPERPDPPFLTVRAADGPVVPVASAPAPPEDDGALDRLVDAVEAAAATQGRARSRSPWLAPLPEVVTAEAPGRAPDGRSGLLRAGVVDEPDHQRVGRLDWDPDGAPWILTGGPGSGRTTGARALALSAASRSGPADLHLHVVASGGGWSEVGHLPHAGLVADVTTRGRCEHSSTTSDAWWPCGARGRHTRPATHPRCCWSSTAGTSSWRAAPGPGARPTQNSSSGCSVTAPRSGCTPS